MAGGAGSALSTGPSASRPPARGIIRLMTDEPMPPELEAPPPPSPPRPRRRRVELIVFLTVLVAALAGAVIWGRPRPSTEARPAFDVVQAPPTPAPPLALRDLGGGPVRLEDYRGRVVLLNFWATWCAPCRE